MRALVLGSGSKGNSTLLIGKNKKILIDVGFSYLKMKELLGMYNYSPTDIDGILITHTHKDHVSGLSSFIKKCPTKVYCNNLLSKEVEKIIDSDNIIINDDNFCIDEFQIELVHTSHDAIGSCGFIVNNYNSSLVYITDTGYINKNYLPKLINKNVYILESNHDINMLMTGPYPYILKQRVVGDSGHLSNELAGDYLKDLIGNKTKKVILAHLSEINNTPSLALQTVKDKIKNDDIYLETAFQNEILDVGEF